MTNTEKMIASIADFCFMLGRRGKYGKEETIGLFGDAMVTQNFLPCRQNENRPETSHRSHHAGSRPDHLDFYGADLLLQRSVRTGQRNCLSARCCRSGYILRKERADSSDHCVPGQPYGNPDAGCKAAWNTSMRERHTQESWMNSVGSRSLAPAFLLKT